MATILSAQSTDKRVNLTTPALFARYRTALDYAQADREELETLIRPTGFYRNKAKSLIGLGQALIERFDGEVPATMDELVTLPGVGRKTANVILGNAFDIPGITVDTHFGRLVRRWRWTAEDDPVKVEHAVGELIERSDWTLLSHRVIFHGRRVCHARKPACGVCVLAKDCPVLRDRAHRAADRRRIGEGPGNRAPAGNGRACSSGARFDDVHRSNHPLDRRGPGGRRGTARGVAVELRDASHSVDRPGDRAGRAHRDADTAAALAGPRQRADLAALSAPGRGAGPAALRGVTAECAADGSAVDVGPALAGHRVVLNLWAYWCGPCADELPAMAEYQRRVGPNVMVVTVHQDENETAALLRMAELGVRLADAAGRPAAGSPPRWGCRM